MAGAIGKSTEVLHAMQSLIKVPEISQTMLELSREMSKVRWHIYTNLIIL
jgi:charged multivesicular body protein 3